MDRATAWNLQTTEILAPFMYQCLQIAESCHIISISEVMTTAIIIMTALIQAVKIYVNANILPAGLQQIKNVHTATR